MDPELWKDPMLVEELSGWSERLGEAGVDMTPEVLRDGLYDWAGRILEVQTTLKAPFEGYYEVAGARQRWRMFPAPDLVPYRLHIDVFDFDTWEPVYRLREPDRAWMADQLEVDRLKSALNMYAWDLYPEAYEDFAQFVATRVREDYPESIGLRLQWVFYRTPTPEEMKAGVRPEPGEVKHEKVMLW